MSNLYVWLAVWAAICLAVLVLLGVMDAIILLIFIALIAFTYRKP